MRRGVLISLLACLLVLAAFPAVSTAGIKHRFFHTADGNISCAMFQDKKPRRKHHRKIPGFPGVARCDVAQHSWVAPPKPTWCPVDWGFGVQVTRKRPGRYVCAGDSVINVNAPGLSPGATVKVGRYTCDVLDVSVRCLNRRNGHGFDVSADSVSLF